MVGIGGIGGILYGTKGPPPKGIIYGIGGPPPGAETRIGTGGGIMKPGIVIGGNCIVGMSSPYISSSGLGAV